MKTLLSLASIAALSVFPLSFFSFEVVTSLIVGAGFTAIVVNDYARTVRPRGLKMTLARGPEHGRERLRLAA